MINISDKDKHLIIELLKQYLPAITSIWAFGSRVTENYKPFTDLDLAIESINDINMSDWIDLKHQLDESTIPFKIDLVNLKDTNSSFINIINKQKQLLLKTT